VNIKLNIDIELFEELFNHARYPTHPDEFIRDMLFAPSVLL